MKSERRKILEQMLWDLMTEDYDPYARELYGDSIREEIAAMSDEEIEQCLREGI